MKSTIPAPPIPSFDAHKSTPGAAATRIKLSAPLDAGFISRIYVSSLWAGAILSMLAYGATNSLSFTGSFIGGMMLGALLLKSQEIFVRRVMGSSAAKSAGGFARFPLALLMGAKFLVIMALMGISMEAGWLHPGAFALGFLTEHLIIIAKVLGRFLSQKSQAASEDRTSNSHLSSHGA